MLNLNFCHGPYKAAVWAFFVVIPDVCGRAQARVEGIVVGVEINVFGLQGGPKTFLPGVAAAASPATSDLRKKLTIACNVLAGNALLGLLALRGFQNTSEFVYWPQIAKYQPMPQTHYIVNQLVKYYDRDYFDYLVKTHSGNSHVKTFSCWNLLMVLTWAQLTGWAACATSSDRWPRIATSFTGWAWAPMCRAIIFPTPAASGRWAFFRKFAARMKERALRLSVGDGELYDLEGVRLLAGVFAVDSLTLPLDLSRFPWSVPQQKKGGLKLHVQYDLLRQLPAFALLTGHEERDQTFMSPYPYRRGRRVHLWQGLCQDRVDAPHRRRRCLLRAAQAP